ncbi:MAG: hypothetical protein IJ712_01355 [Anaerovibrio sp.]|nr:hypothetical protein [Anaerovibrio sp.]
MVEAKAFLNKARVINMEIDSKLKQTQDLRDLVMNITTTISDMPGSPSRNTDKMERIIAKIVDMEHKIDEEIDSLVDLKDQIQSCINSLDDAEYRVLLTERYINFEDWEKIALTMHYTTRYIHLMHRRALRLIQKKLETLH